jgi:hypothetical protein
MNGGQEEINLFFKHLAECNSLQPAIDTYKFVDKLEKAGVSNSSL